MATRTRRTAAEIGEPPLDPIAPEVSPAPEPNEPAKVEPVSVVHETARKRGQRGVTAKRVQPEEPTLEQFSGNKRAFNTAHRQWEKAVAEFEAATKPAEEKPASPKAPRKPRSGPATSSGAFDPSDPKTRAEVVRLHTEGKLSMKAIAEKFGLPAEHKSWLAVSIVWREEADARGLSRPRYPERSRKEASK